jgi:beta-galactosidase
MRHFILFFFLLSPVLTTHGQSYSGDFLYGTAYYHEYMPYERLEEDMKMMQEAGLNFIRIGESTWAKYEPSEGEFHFEWLGNVLDKAHEYGLKVIVGTPTYAIPPWMAKKYPEVMVTTRKGKASYGGRQNMDITNPTYLKFAERMIRKQMEYVHDHPAIIGYQLDNETKSYKTASKYAREKFRLYLKDKYKTVENLNRTWNLTYWSQNLSTFDDFIISDSWANQAAYLEWSRFQHTLVTDFLQWQRNIVEEYIKPDQFVTQNFDLYWRGGQSSGPQPEVDHFASAQTVDISGIDVYHYWGERFRGELISFAGDYTRSFKQDNYFVVETQAQARGWSNIEQYPWHDGQIRQAVYSHMACGANMVGYWPWHSIHNAGETYWKGVLSHDLEKNRAYEEVSKTAHELQKIGDQVVNLEIENDVAILYSIESFNAFFAKPFSNDVNYADLVNQVYRSLFELSVSADFITPDHTNFDDYKLIIVPPLYIASDKELEKIENFVKNGGHVIMMFKSGFCNEDYMVRYEKAPGPLRDVCGFFYQEFYNSDEIPLLNNPYEVSDNTVGGFNELLKPETAKTMARYDDSFFKEYPAITSNDFGKGNLVYEGTMVSDDLQQAIIKEKLTELKLINPDHQLTFPLIHKQGKNQSKKTIHYYFNYSSTPSSFTYHNHKGKDLLNNQEIDHGTEISISPWGVVIIKEE